MAASEILFNFPTISDSGQALNVCLSKVTSPAGNVPVFIKGTWVFAGYLASLGVGVGASPEAPISSIEQARDVLRAEVSVANGYSGPASDSTVGFQMLDLPTADLSKINWAKVLAAFQAIIALFTATNRD